MHARLRGTRLDYLSKIARMFRREVQPAVVTTAELTAMTPGVQSDPQSADTMLALANKAMAARQYAAAAAHFAAVLEVRHEDVEAHLGLGISCVKQNQIEDAVDSFHLAVHFAPARAEPHYHLALLAQKGGDLVAALEHVRRAIELRVDYADAHNLQGACELAAGDAAGAVVAFAKAVELAPSNAHFHSNLGYVLLRDLGDFGRGAAHLKEAMRLDGESFAIRCNYCAVLGYEGRTNEIINICNGLLDLRPDLHEARLSRALALLAQGRFAEAWPDYEARKHTRSNYLQRPYAFQKWNGEVLADKTVLVYAEQGLGDEIMFASCMSEVLARAGRVILECSPRLVPLFARSFPGADVHGADQSVPEANWLNSMGTIDFQVAAGSLPGILRRRREDFPSHAGYLRADPQRVDGWKARLHSDAQPLKVGIAWRGGMSSTRRNLRSVALTDLSPLLQTPGIRFVSLQHDATKQEIAAAPVSAGCSFDHWPEVMADIDETAALVTALDLVITVCSATVHLAGALGRQAWVMVPAVAEWRYLESGDGMPWYPAIRMFRQNRSGEWETVVSKLAERLMALRNA